MKKGPTEEGEVLPTAKRWRPLMLADHLDEVVIKHLQAIRTERGVINSTIVIATDTSITTDHNSGLLDEHGGAISIT